MTDTSLIIPLPQTPAAADAVNPAAPRIRSGKTSTMAQIDATSKDFEAVFLSQMLEHMFTGDDVNQYFGGGTAGDVYKGYLMNELGKSIANAGGIGIASQVKQELLKLQEVAA